MRKPGRIYTINYRCEYAGKLSAVAMRDVKFVGALIQVGNCKLCNGPHKFYLDGTEYMGDDPDMIMSEGGSNETSPDRSNDQGPGQAQGE